MKFIVLGDVVGKSGREAVHRYLPEIRRNHNIDFTIVDGENAAAGFGMTGKITDDFFKWGADVLTAGDHVWDRDEMLELINKDKRILRPANLPSQMPGAGARIFEKNGKRIMVVHLLGQVFMRDHPDSPFEWCEQNLKNYKLGENIDFIIVDFHCEATAEACAMGAYLDGKVTAVVGSHTHIPTADCRVMPGGTAYITDMGMCGDYDSVIGFNKKASVKKFITKNRRVKFDVADKEGTLCGVYFDADDKTGLAKTAKHFVKGANIYNTI